MSEGSSLRGDPGNFQVILEMGVKQDPRGTIGKQKKSAISFIFSSFNNSANTCAFRSCQTHHLTLTSSIFLIWIKCIMMSMRGGQEGQMADVTGNCYHAFYPLQKCGFIVSEGFWLLNWDLHHGYPAFMTLEVMKDRYSLCHDVPFSVILSVEECDWAFQTSLSFFSQHLPPWNVTTMEKMQPLSVCSVWNLTCDS